jgi:hypothetical protein
MNGCAFTGTRSSSAAGSTAGNAGDRVTGPVALM